MLLRLLVFYNLKMTLILVLGKSMLTAEQIIYGVGLKTKAEEESHLDMADFIRAQNTSPPDPANISDPILGRHFEGDIVLPKTRSPKRETMAIASTSFPKTWKDGIVPYAISTVYTTRQRTTIAQAFMEIENSTCIRFVPHTVETNYVFLTPKSGCYSFIGRQKSGRQTVSLSDGCIYVGVIIHELMHALSFYHEQSRPDRNNYIQVQWSNIEDGMKGQFQISNTDETMGLPYDYSSLMHYGPMVFSANGKPTIVALKSNAQNMGQREKMSDLDKQKIILRYCKPTASSNVRLATTTALPLEANSSNCTNQSWRCNAWIEASPQLCDQFGTVRNDLCRKTCGLCDGDEHTEPSTFTMSPPIFPCVNILTHFECTKKVANGRCASSNNVAEKCRKACKLC